MSRVSYVVIGTAAALFCGGVIYHYFTNRREEKNSVVPFDTFSAEKRDRKYFKLSPSVKIHVVETEPEIDDALQLMIDDLEFEEPIVGLDTEWKSDSSLALLQLSSPNVCVLIRLHRLQTLPQSVKQLLEDENIIKSGVAIATDARLLWKEFQILCRGCADLQPIAHQYGATANGSGLKALSKTVLGIRMDKNHHIRCGDWGADTLSQAQIHYAALDAWIGQAILRTLYNKNKSENDSINQFCRQVTDIVHNRTFTPSRKKDPSAASSQKNEELKHLRVPKRKTVLYENCLMLAPDGEALAGVSRKKS
jgi:ribonuclease D